MTTYQEYLNKLYSTTQTFRTVKVQWMGEGYYQLVNRVWVRIIRPTSCMGLTYITASMIQSAKF